MKDKIEFMAMLFILIAATGLALWLAYLERGFYAIGMECAVPLVVGALLIKHLEGEDEDE